MNNNERALLEDFDDSDEFEDHDNLEPTPPAASIQTAAEARRRLEEHWAKKELEARLREIDDWDESDSPN